MSFAMRWWGAFLLCWVVFGNGNAIAFPHAPDYIDRATEHLDALIDARNLQGRSSDFHAPGHSQEHAYLQHHEFHAQAHVQSHVQPRADAPLLRILCLGSSIVGGFVATDQNGFRYGLRSALVADGYKVNMVGSLNIGFMGDNQVEGWGGYRIDEISAKANLSLPSLPNVVCILAGGNDVYQRFDTDGMSMRMGQLIDKILNWVPDTTVIVSTLMPNTNAANDAIMVVYNANLTDVVASRASAGQKVFLVNCNSTWWSLADVRPGNHPTDAGYIKMARVFYDGVILAKDGITAPATPVGGIDDSSPPDLIGGNKCDKELANERGPIRTGLVSGSNDGGYMHSQTLHATVHDMTKMGGAGNSSGLFWADVRLDDYVNVRVDMKQLSVAFSLGAGKFAAAITIDVSNVACARANVRFADIGGDGRDELCCISTVGAISCAANNYVTGVAKPFSKLATFAAAVTGYPGSRNILADIDGDGRADRLIVKANGDIDGWRNAGTGAGVGSWEALGTISSNKTFTDLDGIRLLDINGDGRADLLWLDDSGKATTWINQRGFTSGSLAPIWNSVGITYPGTGVAQTRNLVTFGKIFGTTRTDPIWGAIKTDVVVAKDTAGKASTFLISENTGKNGLRLNGDGVHFCDMRGTGSDDYVWITREGIVQMYGNDHLPPKYKSYGNIFKAARNRQEIHLADFDGDGKCDILLVDKATGAVTMQRNDFNATTGKFAFTSMGVVSGAATCTQGYGMSIVDLGVRFADITGDGKADYMCIKPTGEATAFINNGLNNFTSIGSIRKPTGVERADVRFADVNGDGFADFLTIDQFTGALTVRINNYNNKTGVVGWTDKGVLSPGGRARGAAVFLANLNGTGRADYVIVDPATAIQDTWFNFCPNSASLLGPAPIPLPIDPSNPLSK